MAKKSSKTEQVLKLLSTEDAMEVEDGGESIETAGGISRGSAGFIVNLTQHLVEEKIDEMIDTIGVCSCDICRYDILALALNSLENRFVTSNTGRLHVQLEVYKKQYETDIIAALTKACVKVKASPYHE